MVVEATESRPPETARLLLIVEDALEMKLPKVTRPVLATLKSVVVAPCCVDEAIAKRLRCEPVAPFGVAMVRVAYGVEVPMPTLEAKYEVSVVVAPPFMTRPEASAPAPIVEEATESKPPETIKLLLTVDEPDAIKLPCVTRPMLDTLNSVVVAPCCVEDAITNSVRCAPVAPLGVATVSVPHGVEVPIPTLEAKYDVSVVVAPPLMTRPEERAPAPIVEDAAAIKLCSVEVGVR
jgi:hypothetical protein